MRKRKKRKYKLWPQNHQNLDFFPQKLAHKGQIPRILMKFCKVKKQKFLELLSVSHDQLAANASVQ